MTTNLHKLTFEPDELTQLRAEVRAYIETNRMTQKAFAEQCEVAEGTFGPWLGGTYGGDNDRVAVRVYRYLHARAEQRLLAASVPTAPGFLDLKMSQKVWAGLEHAQVFGDLTVIGVGPGLSKTTTIKQFKEHRPRVYVAAMSPSSSRVPNALIAVLESMGDTDAKGSPQSLSRRVALKATEGALLVIDEAQHLAQPAVDEFRSIHDKTGVGLVFSGDESVFNLFDGSRKRAFAQFHSRIGYRVRASRADKDDSSAIAQAHGVTDPSMIRLCQEIASKPGAYRSLTKTLLLARRHATMADVPLTNGLIREAWSQRAADVSA